VAGESQKQILTINTGSSSLRIDCYCFGSEETLVFSAEAERIGLPDARLQIIDANGTRLMEQQDGLADHAAAVEAVFAFLHGQGPDGSPDRLDAIGHRIVHGGIHYSEPQPITTPLLQTVEDLVPIDPDHLPQALAAIQFVSRAYPGLLQVACFDTAFHHDMPRPAQLYALPGRLAEAGVIRYGFHGLSYEYIMQQLRTEAGDAADGRVIVAHLGNGASMAAVRHGKSIDTTMGFSPTGGLVMGTRSGDLDPGVLLYLLQTQGLTPAAVSELVNKQAGLLGVSGSSGDMRELAAHEASDPRAAEAVELFCYQARKFLGALCTTLGGLDTLIFTAGIGEHDAEVRERICAGLQFLGIELDTARNQAHESIISRDTSGVVVRVMHTDEDRMIARHTSRLLNRQGASDVSL